MNKTNKMIKQKTGTCTGKDGQYTFCGKEEVPLISSRQHCNYCSNKWKNENKKKKGKNDIEIPKGNYKVGKWKNKPKKKTGELAMFLEIWMERKRECEWCGKPQPIFYVHCFAHIKPKGTYPELRLVKANIRILCYYWDDQHGWYGCHTSQTFESKEKFNARKDLYR